MSNVQAGFEYLFEILRDGVVIDSFTEKNLVPTEGLNHFLNVEFKGATQIGTWYLGVYEGNYTPVSTITAATISAAATETTAYNETTRVAFVPGTVASGAVDNSASRAEFTLNATKTIYGGFLSSASAKGATTGVLVSAVKFSSPKSLVSGDVLRVTASFTLTSS